LQSAKVARERLTEQVLLHKEGKNTVLKEDIEIYSNKFVDAINDDLNIPLALGVMWSMIKDLPYSHSVYAEILKMDEIFGLGLNEIKDVKSILKIDVPQDVLDLATLRWQLKIAKKFVEADALRKQIFEMGYELIDTKDCYEVHKI